MDVDIIAHHIEVCQYRDVSIQKPAARCCPALLRGPLKKGDAEELAALFKAIADPARLRILGFLAAQPGGEACVCHLLKPLGLTQPTVSHHLKQLHAVGLLARERRGSWVYYRLVLDRIEALREVLSAPIRLRGERGERHGEARIA
jgi:ArsR family transcriptional regulator, arsenate/arsenite/antimonite-responsive transcriptional repressor